MSLPPPFAAKMETEQFMLMAQSFVEKGKPLVQSYADSETVHEAFFHQTKYKNFESFKAEYYKRHTVKR